MSLIIESYPLFIEKTKCEESSIIGYDGHIVGKGMGGCTA